MENKIPPVIGTLLSSKIKQRPSKSTCGKVQFYTLDEAEISFLEVVDSKNSIHCYVEIVDLVKKCDDYSPIGLFIYIPELDKFGCFDDSEGDLIFYDGIETSHVLENASSVIDLMWSRNAKTRKVTGDDLILIGASIDEGLFSGDLRDRLIDNHYRRILEGSLKESIGNWWPIYRFSSYLHLKKISKYVWWYVILSPLLLLGAILLKSLPRNKVTGERFDFLHDYIEKPIFFVVFSFFHLLLFAWWSFIVGLYKDAKVDYFDLFKVVSLTLAFVAILMVILFQRVFA